MSKERKNKIHDSLSEYILLIAMAILIVLAIVSGFYLFNIESSPSLYTYLGGVALVIAGFLTKFLLDLFKVRKKEKREEITFLKDLLIECEKNLELIASKKILWPQVHFNAASYTVAREKAVLNGLTAALGDQIVGTYQLISEIEKRKLRALDKTTEMMLEKLAKTLPDIVKELEKKIQA